MASRVQLQPAALALTAVAPDSHVAADTLEAEHMGQAEGGRGGGASKEPTTETHQDTYSRTHARQQLHTTHKRTRCTTRPVLWISDMRMGEAAFAVRTTPFVSALKPCMMLLPVLLLSVPAIDAGRYRVLSPFSSLSLPCLPCIWLDPLLLRV